MSRRVASSLRRRSRSLAAAGGLVAVLVGCSPAPMPVSQSAQDPSSPSAPEGAAPVIASIALPVRAPAHDHAAHQHGAHGPAAADAKEGVVYVCPMHPEVTSDGPGTCPKCHMKLVPKK